MPRTLQSVPKRLYQIGDQHAEPGTPAWANWQRSLMKSALKDVHFEARYLVGVIRDMCSGEVPAWHLMSRTDREGGFRTFEEFVTSTDGLSYGDYAKFTGIATSEPGIMNKREYDLITVAYDRRKENGNNEISDLSVSHSNRQKSKEMRAINRAPTLIRQLYIKGLINLSLAILCGPDPILPHYGERKRQAERALQTIESLAHTGDDGAYRQAVNAAVRSAFAPVHRRQKPVTQTPRLPKDPQKLIALARQEYGEAYLKALRQALSEEDPTHA